MNRLSAHVMRRVINPVVGALLRSPLNDLVGPRVALADVTGRRSGRRYRVPVNVTPTDDGLVVVSRADRSWWRNLRGGASLLVWYRGEACESLAEVLDAGWDARTDAVAGAYGAAGRPLDRAHARRIAEHAVVIRLRLGSAVPTPLLRGRPLLRRWVAVTTPGELLGFTAPAIIGALIAAAPVPSLVGAPLLVLAGAIEGAVLGAAQALVLRRALPWLPSRQWIAATSAGAALSYAIALVPSSSGDRLDELPVPVIATGAVVLGSAFLLAMGGLQWRVLHGRLPHAGRWVPLNAGAWTAGLLVFTAIAPPLWHEGQALALVVAIGLIAGCAMALTVAAVLGAGLVRLVETPASSRSLR